MKCEIVAKKRAAAPKVTVIIPCFNEESFIPACLDSLLTGTITPQDMEVFVIDGGSTDRTREILSEYQSHYSCLTILDNPQRIQSAALNIGISAATGEYVVRLDAHSKYAHNHIQRMLEAMEQFGADDVGGRWRIVPRSRGLLAEAIAISLSHPFGIGNARYRLSEFASREMTEPEWVDTVPYFCMRRQRLLDLGPLNENLGPTEDYELKQRLRAQGGKVLLLPDLEIKYFARSDLKSFLKHNWRNGFWAILPWAYSDVAPVGWRHMVPLFFTSFVLLGALIGLVPPVLQVFWVLGMFTYLIMAFAAGFQIARKRNEPRFLLLMPIVFFLLHFVYGLGSLWGLLRLLREKFLN